MPRPLRLDPGRLLSADLAVHEAEALFDRVKIGTASPADAGLFRAQMLTQMALMSLEDGLVMQIHPGSLRNHNAPLFVEGLDPEAYAAALLTRFADPSLRYRLAQVAMDGSQKTPQQAPQWPGDDELAQPVAALVA